MKLVAVWLVLAAASLPVSELAGLMLAGLTALTLMYVVRDRRYTTMHSMYEVERSQNRLLSEKLSECSSRVATLEARPDLSQHAQLLDLLVQQLAGHSQEMHTRMDAHEQRAQERTDAQIAVMREIAMRLEPS